MCWLFWAGVVGTVHASSVCRSPFKQYTSDELKVLVIKFFIQRNLNFLHKYSLLTNFV